MQDSYILQAIITAETPCRLDTFKTLTTLSFTRMKSWPQVHKLFFSKENAVIGIWLECRISTIFMLSVKHHLITRVIVQIANHQCLFLKLKFCKRSLV